ncbi:cytochrome c, mono- and diheme variants family [Rhizobium sp. CF122]|uniref:c-type cytochrome n=1 Tax=Rhizobium sp. CF122 TaxID=1144312 RepID=UPI000271B183|nr:cytochrome c [Rhizobium sp. CF122]EJL55855.1 cytochrome c, mono- and diheme variants family [Rhizobium sp. CF122]
MVRRFVRFLLCLVGVFVIGGAVFYFITAPNALPESHWANLGEPDLKNGEMVFWTGGCVSCHAAPGSEGDAKLTLSGGLALKSPFGIFHVPNISPDETAGIGTWTLAEFGNAMKRGVAKNGEHLYPSFPYNSYARMSDNDVNDLFGYLKTLPKSGNVSPPHELPFPYNMRLALGGWKFLYFSNEPRVALAAKVDDKVKRGQYLVEGAGHCGECHTPRDQFGGFEADRWLAGAPNPEGQGRIPDITPGSKTVASWSQEDIANYLETGFTPDFDTAGGSMAEVQRNLAHLPKPELEAIAAYLKAVPNR